MTRCPLCFSKKPVQEWFSFKNPRKIGSSSLSYLKCSRCFLVFIYPQLSKKENNQLYSDPEYFTKLDREASNQVLSAILKIRFFPEYDEYVNNQFSHPADILDIGCGNGEFLLSMKNRGWNVWGIDQSRIAINNSSKLLKIPLTRLRVADPSENPFRKKFDVVTMWHVVEHLQYPVNFLASVRKLINRNGRLIFEVPNSDSSVLRLFKENYNWLMVPEHIYYYNPKSVRILLENSGFRVVRIDFPPRAMMNFSLSLAKYIKKRYGYLWSRLAFFFSLPFSILFSIFSSFIKSSEVIRIVATP